MDAIARLIVSDRCKVLAASPIASSLNVPLLPVLVAKSHSSTFTPGLRARPMRPEVAMPYIQCILSFARNAAINSRQTECAFVLLPAAGT
jgi:hypothetical protein